LTEKAERKLLRRMAFWQFILRYGAAIVVLIFYVTASLHFSHTPDETYISLQYGRNIARGEGMSFNAGTPSYGITGPLWALLIAGGVTLRLDPYTVAKTLDIVFASLALMAVLAFAYVVIRDRLYAIIAAWIFSFDAWFLRWAGSGTESSLAVLLTVIALWYAYRKEYITSALVAGFLTLVRPEGVLLFLAAQVDVLYNSGSKMSALRMMVSSVILYGMIIGSWFGFSYLYLGVLLPNQVQAMVAGGFSWATIVSDSLTSLRIVGSTQLVPALLLTGGIVITVRRFGWRSVREEGFPLIWMLAVPIWSLIFHANMGSRQMLLILPVVVVYGLWGLKRIETLDLISARRGLATLLLVAAIALAQNQVIYQMIVLPQMSRFELGVSECLKPMAYWLRTNTPAGTTILAPLPGVIGYVSERTVFDASGTVTPDVKRSFGSEGYDQGMMERKYESVIHPDYVIDRSSTPERLTSIAMTPLMTRTFPGLGITKPELVYFTLYKVIR
jgi:hypothetical protein